MGIPVYDADTQAKQLMNTDPELKVALQSCFGDDIYRDGLLRRDQLAELIFNNRAAIEKVNSWVHPAVARDFEQWCARQTAPYVLEEAAIILECNLANRFERLILVTAPDDLRIKRVCARDHVTPETVRVRMNHQWPEEKKLALADYIIYNDRQHLITPQVLKVHRDLLTHVTQ